jgi:hypothetical protein
MSKVHVQRLINIFGITIFSTIILLNVDPQKVAADTVSDQNLTDTAKVQAPVENSPTLIDNSPDTTPTDTKTSEMDSQSVETNNSKLQGSTQLDKSDQTGATTSQPQQTAISNVKAADVLPGTPTENTTNQTPNEELDQPTNKIPPKGDVVEPTQPYPDDAQDTDVIDFPDPILSGQVKSALRLDDDQDVTVGTIRNYNAKQLSIYANDESSPIGNFVGMEAFKYLPSDTRVNFNANFGNNKVDFSELAGVNYGILTLTGNMVGQDLDALHSISTDTIYQVGLSGSGNYQANPNGLTNAQLAVVGDWLTDIYNNDVAQFKHVSLGMNNLTDFSPLSGMNRDITGWVVSLGNYVVSTEPVVNIVDKDVNTVQAEPIYDLTGKNVNDKLYDSTFEMADNKKSHLLKALGNGVYEYDPIAMRSGSTWITYGYYGFIYDSNNPNVSYLQIAYSGDYNKGLVFKYDVMTYRKANVLTAPLITVNYIDQAGTVIKPQESVTGEKIGDAYDLTDRSAIDDYTLTTPEALTGNYTQDPQEITLVYKTNDDSGGNGENPGGGNGGGNGGGSTTDRDVVNSIQYISTHPNQPAVDLYDFDGNKTGNRQLAPASNWYSDKIMTLNGTKYYRVATNEWVKIESAYEYVPNNTLIRTNLNQTKLNAKTLINSETEFVQNRALANGTDWKTDRTAILNGIKYYRVATNEFVKADDVFEYVPVSGRISTNNQTVLYDENGTDTGKTIAQGSVYLTDRSVNIQNQTYYRVERMNMLPTKMLFIRKITEELECNRI